MWVLTVAICSNSGANTLQWPHQGVKKSMIHGSEFWSKILWNESQVSDTVTLGRNSNAHARID